MTTASMMSATPKPCATRANSTATAPEISAPTIGMKEKRKTSTPMAKAKGTLRMAAPTAIPMASTRATMIVARTNADSWSHAISPEVVTRWRAPRGNSRTSHDQMRPPS
jgi:hypothetical protein